MVPLSLAPDRILVRPQYYIQQLEGALPESYARLSVYQKLMKAAKRLPIGYKLVVFDSWRPMRVQQTLFDKMKSRIQRSDPVLTEEEAVEKTTVYVAFPSNDKGKTAPHSTGGAVDLSIADPDGLLLNMGTEFDDTTKKSATVFWENLLLSEKKLSAGEREALENRRLLYHTMADVGLTNYSDEWWHYEYGDQNWAWHTGHLHAIYGKITVPFPWNQQIE